MANVKKSSVDVEEVDSLSEIVSLAGDVLERTDFDSIAKHFTLMKRAGVVLIIFTSILCFVAAVHIVVSSVETQTCPSDRLQTNPIVCGVEQKYSLGEDVYLTVCSKRNVSVIEMRKFLNGRPTPHGLYLSLLQWTFLKRLVPFVDRKLHTLIE